MWKVINNSFDIIKTPFGEIKLYKNVYKYCLQNLVIEKYGNEYIVVFGECIGKITYNQGISTFDYIKIDNNEFYDILYIMNDKIFVKVDENIMYLDKNNTYFINTKNHWISEMCKVKLDPNKSKYQYLNIKHIYSCGFHQGILYVVYDLFDYDIFNDEFINHEYITIDENRNIYYNHIIDFEKLNLTYDNSIYNLQKHHIKKLHPYLRKCIFNFYTVLSVLVKIPNPLFLIIIEYALLN